MKKTIQNKILTGLLILLVCSCVEKKWDEYYAKPEYLKNGRVYDILTKNGEYKEFTSLLKKTGCDSILSRYDQHTVFAIRNGAFAGIDTVSNLPALKKILGMHILPSSVYKENMDNTSKQGVSGKLLKFSSSAKDITVNNIRITKFDTKTANGVIHEVENLILPTLNLYDAIFSSTDLSSYQNFIALSYKSTIDPVSNIKIGFDTINKPIYEEPIKYIQSSEYLNKSRIQDESILTTGFFPTLKAVNKVISDMLVAKGGKIELIAPRLSSKHGDTIVGGRFFKKAVTYPGDTMVLLNDLYNHILVRGDISALNSNTNYFTNISGNQISVAKTQVKTDAQVVSNGNYYVLDEVTVPEIFYRKEFMFLPIPKITDPKDPSKTIASPYIIYSNEANTNPTVVSSALCYTGRFTRFNFTKVGAMIDFVFPFVTKGYYKVVLSYFPESNSGIVGASYGNQQLAQNINTSTQLNSRALRYVTKELGTINVINHGQAQIKFTCTNSNLVNFNQYNLAVDFLQLVPVTAP